MNLTQEEFDAWIDRLQHGGDRQTVRYLYNASNGGYCCMGICGLVLGIAKERMNVTPVLSSLGNTSGDDPNDKARNAFDNRESNLLAALNDHMHLTFPQIAAFVLVSGLDAYEIGVDGTLMDRQLGGASA